MKHIVFVVGNYKNAGVAMHATNLANEFAQNGHLSTILVDGEIGGDIFFEHHKNVNVISLKNYISKHDKDINVIRSIRRKKLEIRFLKYVRHISKHFPEWDRKLAAAIKGMRASENIAVFAANHTNCIYIPFGFSYLEKVFWGTKGTNSKIIYAEKNPPELEFPSDTKEKERIFKILSKIDGTVLQTKNELDFFEGKLKNAVVINNPVKANLPEPFEGERRNTVVNFCRISTQKNLPLMIKAFIEFHKTYPEYTLEIYGNTVNKIEEDLKKEYIDMISSLNAEEYIKIFPPRADIHSIVRDCAMFVSSSDFEGLSNSMIEAMAIGLPCVCTDCIGGGARELITDGENGLLVPMNDSGSLAKAMCRMAEDKKLSAKCAENAAKVRETHAVEEIAGKWLEIINSII